MMPVDPPSIASPPSNAVNGPPDFEEDETAHKPKRRQRLAARLPPSLRPLMRSARFTATRTLSAAARRWVGYCPGTSRRFGPPRAFVPSLQEYARRHSGPGVVYREIYGEHVISRSLPLFLSAATGAAGDGDIRVEFRRAQKSLSPAAGVATIAGGRVLTVDGTVIAPPDQFIADVSDAWTAGDHVAYKIFLSRRLPPVTVTGETVAVLTTHCSGFNYGHWISDTVPRLHLLEKSGIAYDKIVVPDELPFHREVLDLLDIEPRKMITAPHLHIEAARLVVPNFPGLYGAAPRWACHYVRDRLLPHARPSGRRRRILISRNRPGALRRIVNEDALFDALRPFGFERVFPEDLSFVEEMSLFQDAEAVIGALGAGMTNTIWCKPGTAVIELFSPRYVHIMNWMIADHVGLRYAYALGKGEGELMVANDRGIYDDILVDIEEVVGLFRILCPP